MVRWGLFVGAAAFLAFVLLALARATARTLTGQPGRTAVPARGLLLNAALSHGLFGALLVATAWYARIPPAALGVSADARAVPLGVALGLALALANGAGERLLGAAGIEYDGRLRDLLAPTTRGEWALLLLVVLPLVAGVEELLFRAALVGVPAAGFGVPPWLLAVASSALFGLGHGLQGRGGILAAGVLGLVLAGAFVLTGSLAAVIVAHYTVNALEFLRHEGPSARPGS